MLCSLFIFCSSYDFVFQKLTGSLLRFQFFVLFQIIMTKCHKVYPHCIWHVPPEGQCLNICSAILTKVYCNHSTKIVSNCATPFHPTRSKLNIPRKVNKQFQFISKAMASPNEILCHHSLTCSDPPLDEILVK